MSPARPVSIATPTASISCAAIFHVRHEQCRTIDIQRSAPSHAACICRPPTTFSAADACTIFDDRAVQQANGRAARRAPPGAAELRCRRRWPPHEGEQINSTLPRARPIGGRRDYFMPDIAQGVMSISFRAHALTVHNESARRLWTNRRRPMADDARQKPPDHLPAAFVFADSPRRRETAMMNGLSRRPRTTQLPRRQGTARLQKPSRQTRRASSRF